MLPLLSSILNAKWVKDIFAVIEIVVEGTCRLYSFVLGLL